MSKNNSGHQCDHNHSHNHHEHNHDISELSAKKLFFVIVLNFGITFAEIIGGLISGSLSLLSDALHNFSDAIAVIISYIAIKLGQRKSSFKHTFGLKRAEILAALINSSVLIGVSIFLFVEAYKKFVTPEPITGSVMLIVAFIGLLGNILSIFLLEAGAHDSINIKSAYLHMLSDAVSSVSVILGALGIILFKIYWIDPLLTVLIGLYVLYESFKILKKSVHILMEGAPLHLPVDKVKSDIENINGVKNAHHIHLWSLGEKDVFLEAHVEIDDMTLKSASKIRKEIENHLKNLGITHLTIQLELDECNEKNALCS